VSIGDLRAEIKKLGQKCIIYVQCTLAMIFDFDLSQTKVVSDLIEVHLNVSK
jgi:hypothetical protein